MSESSEINVFGNTDFRGRATPFGIKRADRRAHIYIIGKTGTGKSTLMEILIRHDVTSGNGFCLLDPHGDSAAKILAIANTVRPSDVINFDAADSSQPYGFNPLANVHRSKRNLAASGMISVFKHLWRDSWGPRLEHLLRNSLLALLEQHSATLADISPLLYDDGFRRKIAANVTNEQVRKFWLAEYERYPARLRAEAASPLQNKVGAFLSNPLLNKILTRPQSPLNLRKTMDEGKILIVNLAKGKIGEDTSSLLGSLLISRLALAALSRADVPESSRTDFHLFADEFHSFTTLTLASMLSELRKYRLNLILAHQYLAQLDPAIKDAVMGNVGTMIVFRIGATDAEQLASEFSPEFAASDLTNLPNRHIYLKLMIDGRVSKPFSAITLNSDSS